MSKLRIAPAVVALALVFAACGDSDGGNVATNDPTATTAAASGSDDAKDDGAKDGDHKGDGDYKDDGANDDAKVGATVKLKDLKFNPDEVTIKAGEAVKWEWDENVLHNVHGDDFESPNTPDGPYQHRFKKAGTYEYQCTLHAGMTGKVIVE
jgi:plastocyanin